MPAADSTTRFSSRVKDYVAYRPSYPAAVIALLQETFCLPPDALIADIGSGTGILSAQLLSGLSSNQVRVVGIEPNKEMREAGDEILARHAASERFSSRDGTAEATGLPDHTVDLVVAAQAFHWFDVPRARAECARILKPNGRAGVALIWNERRGIAGRDGPDTAYPQADAPVMSAYDLLLVQRVGEEYRDVAHHRRVDETSLRDFYGPAGFELRSISNPTKMNYDQLKGRLMSSSYTPQEGEQGHERLIEELKMLYDQYQEGGMINFVYATRVITGLIS